MEVFNETVIEHTKNDKFCAISTGEMAVKNRLAKLAESHPDDVKLIAKNDGGSVYYHIPFKWVKLSPPRKVEMTDEKREALTERLKLAREKQKTR